MRVLMQLVLAVCLIPFFGCSKNIRVNFDPLAIFPATSTWVWNDAKNILPDHPSMEILHIDRLLRAEVEEGFAGRGYTEVPRGSEAEYEMHYEVGLGLQVGGTQRPAVATASIELTEISTGRQVWVGFMKTNVDVSLTEKQRVDRLRRNMRKMLKNFPPS